ncbi:response regulator [Acetobacteraceae bacterium KSS8]|uniref:Response regulator n=1 Tax=Endosaccharibacter trunci TaxID=2812733 RepID=A0ABT1W7M2_9PROT|nr:response regulator [Acetobacteraceae bacterium KSS8]
MNHLAGRLCLIVDDSRTVRRIARTIVEDAGMRTREAADGLEALSACRDERPDYVLLDWNMPNMNGLDCLKAIRREFGDTAPSVILCTTENEPDFIISAIEAGAEEFVMKPFDADILLGKLTQVSSSTDGYS